MSAAQYKLTYFDIRGLGELARLTLTAAGVPFTDDRIPFIRKEDGSFDRGDWEERKKSTPYGQVPVLTLANGQQIAQSAAILRFIARKHGLEGSNEIETALIDGAYEAILDIRKAFFTNKADAAKVAEFWSKTFGEQVETLAKNVTGNGFFVGNKISYADIAIYYTMFVLETENKDAVQKVLGANPKIKAIVDSVAKNEKIAPYVAARKVTIF